VKLAELRAALRHPLYRYEARHYWSWGRYEVLGGILVTWWAVLAVVGGLGGLLPTNDAGECALSLAALAVLGRLPLRAAAAGGAALCIAPEKASGQLEQFVLTPIDPWQFCLARMFGRLRGIFMLWALMGAALVLAAFILWTRLGPQDRDADGLFLLAVVVAMQVDSAGMILADAALGMYFSAKERSTVSAVARTLAVCFVVSPLAPPFEIMVVADVAGPLLYNPFSSSGQDMIVMGAVHVLVAGLTAYFFPSDSRKSMEQTFYQPGEAP
jgi:hypothetical protein